MNSLSKLEMAHEYICANAQAGKEISLRDAFEYVENVHAEAAKVERKELDALLNMTSLRCFEIRPELSASVMESLGEVP